MGIYFNPNNDRFQKAVRSEIYVDKTTAAPQTEPPETTQSGLGEEIDKVGDEIDKVGDELGELENNLDNAQQTHDTLQKDTGRTPRFHTCTGSAASSTRTALPGPLPSL